MSHFNLLVVSSDELSEESLADLLEPFNEQPDSLTSPYLQLRDCNDEVTEGWEKDQYTGDYKDIDEYAEDYHGYKKIDGRYGYLRNPNAKWDWYQVGGRWSGLLKLKEKPIDPNNPPDLLGFDQGSIQAIVEHLKTGPINPGRYIDGLKQAKKDFNTKLNTLKLAAGSNIEMVDVAVDNLIDAMYPPHMTGEESWCNSPAKLGYADVAMKKHIDIEGMELPQRLWAEKTWDEFYEIRNTLLGKSYADLMKDIIESSKDTPYRDIYKSFPEELKKWSEERFGVFSSYNHKKQLLDMSREEYVACNSIWSPFALLWNGKWYENGKMGWFGISFNKEEQWNGIFKELWNEIPEDATVMVVDCHI